MARKCVFCDCPANTVEDVLPLWLANLLEPKQGERAYHRMEGAYWESGAFRARVRRVCGACNHGWMSDLEGQAKPLLTRLIFGQSTVVSEDSKKRTLSAWALKTAITLDLAKKGQASRIPPEHCRFLGTYKCPLQDVSIWLGAMQKQKPGDHHVTLWQRATHRIVQGAAVDETPLQLYFVAFFIGNAVFQVFGRLGGRGLIARLNDSTVGARSLPLWPIQEGDIEWPPSLSHTP